MSIAITSNNIESATKVHIVKAMIFPEVIYECESWTIKMPEHTHTKIDTFNLWCWRRVLRVSWTAGSSNHSIVKEIIPAYSLED